MSDWWVAQWVSEWEWEYENICGVYWQYLWVNKWMGEWVGELESEWEWIYEKCEWEREREPERVILGEWVTEWTWETLGQWMSEWLAEWMSESGLESQWEIVWVNYWKWVRWVEIGWVCERDWVSEWVRVGAWVRDWVSESKWVSESLGEWMTYLVSEWKLAWVNEWEWVSEFMSEYVKVSLDQCAFGSSKTSIELQHASLCCSGVHYSRQWRAIGWSVLGVRGVRGVLGALLLSLGDPASQSITTGHPTDHFSKCSKRERSQSDLTKSHVFLGQQSYTGDGLHGLTKWKYDKQTNPFSTFSNFSLCALEETIEKKSISSRASSALLIDWKLY